MKNIWIAERKYEHVEYQKVSNIASLFHRWSDLNEIATWQSTHTESTITTHDEMVTQHPAPGDLLLDCSLATSYANDNGLEIIWAKSHLYEQSSDEERKELWKEAGLIVRPHLPDERLYIARSMNLMLLSIQRVNEGLEPLGEALSLTRDSKNLIEYEDKSFMSSTIRKIELIAARALHCLLLDAGTVCIALSGTGTVAVRKVWTWTDSTYSSDASAAASSLQRLLDMPEEERDHIPILIGADPEFALIDGKGKLVSASTFFSTDQHEEFGADALVVRRKWAHPIAELRPSPSSSPDVLLRNIHGLMVKAARHMNDTSIQWLAGGMPRRGISLGGHIHISGISCTSSIVRLLDRYVALPLRLIEDPNGSGRRPKYGALGDFRRQGYGGFEYRTLPSWLVSPSVAKIALSLGWLVVTEHKELLQMYNENDGQWKALASTNPAERLKGLDLLLAQLRSLKSASSIETTIALLQQSVVEGRCWNEQRDIRMRWNVAHI